MVSGGERRTDTASRIIKASAETIYRALLDPVAIASWLPPEGMTGEVDVFEPREGGHYRMTLTYTKPNHEMAGKASQDAEVVEGTFVALDPNRRIVQRVEFQSDDPAFAGSRMISWHLHTVSAGTEVAGVCENVPPGIAKEDHDAGLRSTLNNLALYVERSIPIA